MQSNKASEHVPNKVSHVTASIEEEVDSQQSKENLGKYTSSGLASILSQISNEERELGNLLDIKSPENIVSPDNIKSPDYKPRIPQVVKQSRSLVVYEPKGIKSFKVDVTKLKEKVTKNRSTDQTTDNLIPKTSSRQKIDGEQALTDSTYR